MATKSDLVKVVSSYLYVTDTLELWGVGFTFTDGAYTAELPKAQADEMIAANRVKLG